MVGVGTPGSPAATAVAFLADGASADWFEGEAAEVGCGTPGSPAATAVAFLADDAAGDCPVGVGDPPDGGLLVGSGVCDPGSLGGGETAFGDLAACGGLSAAGGLEVVFAALAAVAPDGSGDGGSVGDKPAVVLALPPVPNKAATAAAPVAAAAAAAVSGAEELVAGDMEGEAAAAVEAADGLAPGRGLLTAGEEPPETGPGDELGPGGGVTPGDVVTPGEDGVAPGDDPGEDALLRDDPGEPEDDPSAESPPVQQQS